MKGNERSHQANYTTRLTDMLREQGEEEQEIALLLPVLSRLPEWQAAVATPADTTRLLSALTPLVTTSAQKGHAVGSLTGTSVESSVGPPPVRLSPVRQALQERVADENAGVRGEFVPFLGVARAQVSLLRPTFWVVSGLIAALGTLAMLSGLSVDQAFILRAAGPLLAVVSVNSLVRSANLRVLEIELSCPVSPLRLALARLVVVLGYDMALGLTMSLLLWAVQDAGSSFLTLTLHWLAPLLLVAGVALLLSLKMHPAAAASTAYAGWLLVLSLAMLEGPDGRQGFTRSLLAQGELALLVLGGCLLLVALLSVRKGVVAVLPRS